MDQLPDLTTPIHFVYPVGKDSTGVSEYRIACMPDVIELHQTPLHPNYQRTGDIMAVTCLVCKKSDTFKKVTGQTS